jgi:glycosyltransferase involved in cell wall biosynthesis
MLREGVLFNGDVAKRSSMKTSIIICFYEKPDYLKLCLDSLKCSSNDFDEVVVADDGSSVDVVNKVKKYIQDYPFPVIHTWHAREGARRAACRNNGIRHAQGDYLIFFDADFAILPGAVQSHINAAKPGWFAAGRCKYTTEEQVNNIFSKGISAELLEHTYKELREEPIVKEHNEFIRYGILRKLRLASARRQTFGGHFSIHKKDIESVNGYDENYVGWGGEDQDMAMRLVMAGFRGTSVIKSSRVLHLWHPKEIGNKHWKEGANVEYFFRKKPPVYCENGLIKKRSS